jgi:hypothetical protein
MAINRALFDLIAMAADKGADAIWMPSYVWTITTSAEMKKSCMGGMGGSGFITYDLTVYAKAVKFVPLKEVKSVQP